MFWEGTRGCFDSALPCHYVLYLSCKIDAGYYWVLEQLSVHSLQLVCPDSCVQSNAWEHQGPKPDQRHGPELRAISLYDVSQHLSILNGAKFPRIGCGHRGPQTVKAEKLQLETRMGKRVWCPTFHLIVLKINCLLSLNVIWKGRRQLMQNNNCCIPFFLLVSNPLSWILARNLSFHRKLCIRHVYSVL